MQNNSPIYFTPHILSKIWYLCKTINNVEWSGIIFYKTEGHPINSETFSITAIDILPMHKGEPTYTEFEIDDRIIDAYDNNPELEECKLGIIHSHASMDVFFSNTDTITLHEYAKLSNYCISVIVNNNGNIICKIAYPIIKKVCDLNTQYRDNNGNWVVNEVINKDKDVILINTKDMDVIYNIDNFFLDKTNYIINLHEKKSNTQVKNYYYDFTNYENINNNNTNVISDQINNYLCKLLFLDINTNLIDIKRGCIKMDKQLKNLNTKIYENMIYDQIENYYLEIITIFYPFPINNNIEQFISECINYLLINDYFNTKSGKILYNAITNYYTLKQNDRKI